MAHIHTGPGQHDHTASVYIVRTDGNEPAVLLHLHKTLGRFLQFGGHIELDENPWQAVTHEILEESGYELDQLELLQPPERIASLSSGVLHPTPLCCNTHAIGDQHFHSDTSWAFVTGVAPSHDVAAGESLDLRTFTLRELVERPGDAIDPGSKEICQFIFEVCLSRWDRVPAGGWGR